MFYCDTCGEKNNWPKHYVKSYGPCEICQTMDNCSDVPSHQLPGPDEVPVVNIYREVNGYWSEHPEHPISDWRGEVMSEDTKQGYWEWAESREMEVEDEK